jgi:anthranilate phosphoribosyltransferase
VALLDGAAHPAAEAIVLNAAATLVIVRDLAPRLAAEQAREALRGGAARRALETWRAAARRAKGSAP